MSDHISDKQFTNPQCGALVYPKGGQWPMPIATILNDLSSRLRAQDERIAGLEREIEALKPKPLEYTSGILVLPRRDDLKVQQ